MQESQHEREGIDSASRSFRSLTGLVALAAFLWIAIELWEPLFVSLWYGGVQWVDLDIVSFFLPIMAACVGWGGLVYACWFRSGRITGTALGFVLALGICGMAISHVAFGGPVELIGIVLLTGTWILNGLGIVWIVQRVRRIRAASNTDEADAAR